jgi:hypothetical protein
MICKTCKEEQPDHGDMLLGDGPDDNICGQCAEGLLVLGSDGGMHPPHCPSTGDGECDCHDAEACEHVHCPHCGKALYHVLVEIRSYSPMSFTVGNDNVFQPEEPLGRGDLCFSSDDQTLVCQHCLKPLNP